MIFVFIVRHLRWVARIPFAPDLFDAFLIAWTSVTDRERLRAIEELERSALELPGVRAVRHRMGGIGFAGAGGEFGHIHGNGLLDVVIERDEAERLTEAGLAGPHHVFGHGKWVSFWVCGRKDVRPGIALLRAGLMHVEQRKGNSR